MVSLFLPRLDRVLDVIRDPVEFFFKAGHEFARPVLKENDKAESEKHKEQKPEQTPDETHARTLTDWLPAVNDWNTTIPDTARQRRADMLR
jgi:hypothetical protein